MERHRIICAISAIDSQRTFKREPVLVRGHAVKVLPVILSWRHRHRDRIGSFARIDRQ